MIETTQEILSILSGLVLYAMVCFVIFIGLTRIRPVRVVDELAAKIERINQITGTAMILGGVLCLILLRTL